MAHFAQLNDSNEVIAVNVVADEDCLDSDGNESEAVGIAFCKSLWGSDTNWKQTSYNNNIRKQFAIVGSSYDPTKNKFISAKPYASWTLNSDDDWQSPLGAIPVKENCGYTWDESAYQANNSTGWIEHDISIE